MWYVSGLMRSMVTPRSGSVRSSCLCCFSREVALYCTNLPRKKMKCQDVPMFMGLDSACGWRGWMFTCADQMDMWWIWGQRGCQEGCCSTSLDRPPLTCHGHKRTGHTQFGFKCHFLKKQALNMTVHNSKKSSVLNLITSLEQSYEKMAWWKRRQKSIMS